VKPIDVPTPPYVVIDATVALKWALDDGEAVAQAAALRDDSARGKLAMLAPSLWVYDITSSIRAAVASKLVPGALGDRIHYELMAAGVFIADPEPPSVLRRANSLDLAGHDAAYIALAEALSIPLWLGDRSLYEAARGQANAVRWIGDYPLGETSK
jgi:predicted nucleic acid-binding protein